MVWVRDISRILARIRGYFFVITFFNLRCLRTCACWSATVHECIYAPHVKCSLARFFWACHCELQRIYWFKSTSFDIFVFFFKEKAAKCHFQFSEEERIFFLGWYEEKEFIEYYIHQTLLPSEQSDRTQREKRKPSRYTRVCGLL